MPFVAIDNSRLHVEIGPPVDESECKKGGWEQFNTPGLQEPGRLRQLRRLQGEERGQRLVLPSRARLVGPRHAGAPRRALTSSLMRRLIVDLSHRPSPGRRACRRGEVTSEGDYGCTYSTFSGTFYAGTLNIKSKTKYKVNDKNKGEYTTKRHRINFKTGSYKTPLLRQVEQGQERPRRRLLTQDRAVRQEGRRAEADLHEVRLARRNLLHGPAVAVRVAEEDEPAPREVLHLTDLHPALDELGASGVDV